MLKLNKIIHNKIKKILTIIFLLSFLFSLIFIIIYNSKNYNQRITNYQINNENYINYDDSPKNAALWAFLNLTNTEINGTRFCHNASVPIEGRLYYANNTGISGYKVALKADGVLYTNYNNVTITDGIFKIFNFTLFPFMNIYVSHKIEAEVIDYTPGDVTLRNYLTIYANATSYFDIQSYNLNSAQFAGGFFNLPNYLRYDNNSGVPYQQVNYSWYNESKKPFGSLNSFNTNPDGTFKQILIQNDNSSKIMYLNITYIGNGTLINGTSLKSIPINVYRNITCDWITVSSAVEGNIITISGQIYDRNNSNHILNFTEFIITRNGDSIGNTTTNADGIFSFSYQLPTGSGGINTFNIELSFSSSAFSNVSHIISVSSPLIPPAADDIGDKDTEDETPPFQNFFLIFIPIIISIIAVLIIFGYYKLRKQEIESKLVRLPLEDRIRNFKILKDTGRLEEALSYLFQSIYMELVNAKYGKRKKETETIRDFAIISVKEFKLNPAAIYPFIQNIEKVIYDKPFLIKEEDFYNSVQLFSPVYFELTGYHFVLNF